MFASYIDECNDRGWMFTEGGTGQCANTTDVLSQHGYQAAGTVEGYTNTTTVLAWMTAAYEGKRFDLTILVTAGWVRENRP